MPQLTALCAGSNYPTTYAELNGCVNDAKDWHAEAQARGYASTLLLEPRRDEFLAHLEEKVGQLRWRDRLIVTVSGHGTTIASRTELDGTDEALVMGDLNLITDKELAAIFRRRAYGSRITFLPDTCYSGGVNRAHGAPRNRADAAIPRYLPPVAVVNGPELRRTFDATKSPRTLSRAGIIHVAACAENEVAYDAFIGGRWRGAFTASALATLTQAHRHEDWIQTITAHIRHPQTPQLDASLYQRRLAPLAR